MLPFPLSPFGNALDRHPTKHLGPRLRHLVPCIKAPSFRARPQRQTHDKVCYRRTPPLGFVFFSRQSVIPGFLAVILSSLPVLHPSVFFLFAYPIFSVSPLCMRRGQPKSGGVFCPWCGGPTLSNHTWSAVVTSLFSKSNDPRKCRLPIMRFFVGILFMPFPSRDLSLKFLLFFNAFFFVSELNASPLCGPCLPFTAAPLLQIEVPAVRQPKRPFSSCWFFC